jgi:hypothetical protein
MSLYVVCHICLFQVSAHMLLPSFPGATSPNRSLNVEIRLFGTILIYSHLQNWWKGIVEANKPPLVHCVWFFFFLDFCAIANLLGPLPYCHAFYKSCLLSTPHFRSDSYALGPKNGTCFSFHFWSSPSHVYSSC